ncbi:hypothetical protein KFL_004030060 [Klebsormidium nitens]|uniref:Uncharacterized protein n=1 Tax=Klebsormidium nitens TaxID=105231 RepID=A0A1Y1IHC7_KLENI|nr:hypothetical protein KFL_004030060 [Klebsormidium nitens]|eukprot:GAQ88136.1 hypothetical protein KFL_004030060 [Klebsormidium nitens]
MARTKATARREFSKRNPASSYGIQRDQTTLQKAQPTKTSNAKKKAATKPAAKPAKGGRKASTSVVGEYSLKVTEERSSGGMFGSYEADDEDSEEYSMSVFESGGHTWARFELETVEGCAKFGKRTVSKGQTTYAYQWRGRETGEGEIQCASDQKGTFKFHGDKIEGTMKTPFGDLILTGEKVSDEPDEKSASMWDYCTEEQHEVERVNRWK